MSRGLGRRQRAMLETLLRQMQHLPQRVQRLQIWLRPHTGDGQSASEAPSGPSSSL